jgi:hypothetical protein
MKIRKYRVIFERAPEFNAVWSFELGESGAFKYGNGTCVIICAGDKPHDCVDTRYDQTVTQDFGSWCENYMNTCLNSELKPSFEFLIEE